jgi:hypothetical protein
LATEITALLLAEKKESRGTLPDQNIHFILKLDEGHDRPVWIWVYNSDSEVEAKRISPLVPQMPETILQDGLLLLIAEGLRDEGLRAALNSRRNGPSRLYDLNLPDEGDYGALRNGIREALASLNLRLVRLPGCSITAEQATANSLEVVSFS